MSTDDVPKRGVVHMHIDSSAKIAHSIPEAVAVTGVSRSAIYAALKAGELCARKRGRRTIIEDGELRRYIASLPVFVQS
jgi:hypothetical protein